MTAQWRYSDETREWVLAQWTADGLPVEVLGVAGASTLTAVNPALRERVVVAMLEHHGIRPPAYVFDGPPGEELTMTCPRCWRVSWNPNYARNRYCGACHVFPEGSLVPAQRAGDAQVELPR